MAGKPKAHRPKRDDVLDAAVAVLLDCGYDAASMDKVARAAGVSRRTLFNQFESKEALFAAAVERVWEKMSFTTIVAQKDALLDAAVGLTRIGMAIVDFWTPDTAIALARSVLKAQRVLLVGWDAMGPATVLARAVAGDAVARTAADLNQFRFDAVTRTDDPRMLPGAVKYGGLGAALALAAPADVMVHNHAGTGTGRVAEAAYAAAGGKQKLVRHAEKLDAAAVARWLLG